MADEEDPWGFDGGEESAPPAAATPAASAAAASPAVAVASREASEPTQSATAEHIEQAGEGTETAAAPPPPPEDDGYRKPVQLYRHWVRPKFLQYKYMYNYRTNYYDDVIDYIDKKQVGVSREIPRPQTWAERVLRTNYCSANHLDNYPISKKGDRHLTQTLAASVRTYNYHTKAYLNQKYAHVL